MFVCVRVVFVVPEWHEATCNTNQATSLHVPSFVKQKKLIVILSTHSTLNFFRSYRDCSSAFAPFNLSISVFKRNHQCRTCCGTSIPKLFFLSVANSKCQQSLFFFFFFVLMLHISPLHTIHFSSKFICFITVYFSLSFFVFIFKKKCAVRFVWRFCCFSFISDRRFVVFFLRFSCGGKKWLVFQQACRSAA